MKFKQVRSYLSSARISRYLTATSNSQTRAVRLYKANLKVAQAFHPLLGLLEVILRNRLNDILTAHFSDPDWIINQRRGFMVHPSLTYIHKRTGKPVTNDFLKKDVDKAERRLRKLGVAATSGKIIAELTFGFWTDIFEPHHYRILFGKPIKMFSTLPTGYGRKEVCAELHKIRKFRNRINHNEPICFNGINIDFSSAEDVHKSMKDILSWIDPEIVKWVAELDTVQNKINNAKKNLIHNTHFVI